MRYSVDKVVETINSLEETKEEKREKIKRNIKKGLSVSLASACIYCMISGISMRNAHSKGNIKEENTVYYNNQLTISDEEAEKLYEIISEKIGEDVSDNANAIILSGAVVNSNLTQEEKNIVYKFASMLEDNPYVDQRSAYEALRNVDIIYEENGDGEYSNKIIGIYSKSDDTIKIFSEDSENKIKYHELTHCIFTTNQTSKLPSFFVEGVTEILTNEYFEDMPFVEDKSYPYEITMVKMLADIVGSDIILKTYTTGDINTLKDALKKKMDNIDVEELLNNMELLFKQYEEKDTVDAEKIDFINRTLDSYYYNLSDSAENNLQYEIYLYNRGILSTMKMENPNVAYIYYLMENGYYTKAYFSKELKKEYSEIRKEDYSASIKVEDSEKIMKKTYE